MALIKKLTKIGNSWGVILPGEIMKMAGIETEGECEISVEESGIMLRPHSNQKPLDEEVTKAMSRFFRKYQDDLKKLS